MNQPEPGPSKLPEDSSTINSPVETRAPHSAIQGSSVDRQTGSLSSHRGPRRAQLIPFPGQSASTLSTKARIAEGMGKGAVLLNQSKYKGMRIQKNVNLAEESRSPVTSSTVRPQSPLSSSQGALLHRSSDERINQAPIRKASLQQHSPPPPPPDEPSHIIEPDRMSVDQPEFVYSSCYCHFFNSHQPARSLLPDRRFLQQQTIYYKR